MLAVTFSMALASVAAYLTANPLLTAASIVTLFILVRLLWRAGEPPVLLFAAGMQWVQVATIVLDADLSNRPVTALSIAGTVETAIWLSLGGLIALAVGMRVGLRNLRPVSQRLIDEQMRTYSIDRLFVAYLLATMIGSAMPYFAWRIASATQPLLILASVKWVFYILLGYATLRRKVKQVYFIIATVVEIVAGIGFFSEFKTVFFICGLVLFSLGARMRLRTIVAVSATATAVFIASLAWMSIREEYRMFLNQGTGQQVVLVSPVEQVKAFSDLVSNLDEERLTGASQTMLKRLEYVDYFGAALSYVPKRVPFENGGLLWRALVHILVPRFLFPGKPSLESDSDITMRYTGLTIASTEQGTSISLGYMAETYIDFGAYGMFIPIFFLGLLWALMYRWFIVRGSEIATGFAFATTLLISAGQFEIAETKLLGAMISRFLIFSLLLLYVMPRVDLWLRAPRKRPLPISARPVASSGTARL